MGRKEGAGVPLSRGEWQLGARVTQCVLGIARGLLPYKVTSSSIQPFGDNRHEPKTGGCATFGGTEVRLHLTQRRRA